MSKIISFKVPIPKAFQDNNAWNINDTPVFEKNEAFHFQNRSKYKTIDFSIVNDEAIKNELKNFLWDLLEKDYLEMTIKNFKDKFLPTFINLLHTIQFHNISGSLLNIEFRDFKEKISSNDREPQIFRKIQLFLLDYEPFEKENEVWDILQSPMNRKGIFNKYETSEGRIINFSIIENETLKEELKNYLYSYVNQDFKNFDPKTCFNNHLLPFQSILRSLKNINEKTILDINHILLENELKKDGKIDVSYYVSIFERIRDFVIAKKHLNNFERDVWDLKALQISEERINKTKNRNTLSFLEIDNEDNKQLLKKYIKYLLLNSQLSLSTIISKSDNLKNFLIQFGSFSLRELKISDREHVISIIQKNKQQEKTLSNFNKFLIYLSREKEVSYEVGKNFITTSELKSRKVEFNDRFVEETIIKQMFQKIEKRSNEYEYLETIFYLLTFCGLRISEICNLKLDCLYADQNNIKRLRFESTKMRKHVDIPIIEKVYNKVNEQKKNTQKKEGDNKNFLFPSNGTSQSKKTKNKPISTNFVSNLFKRFCDENEINDKNNEGYNFKAHDYRHTFATHLAENNVSIEVIKELLAHETPQMTLAYLDKKQEREKKSIERELQEAGKFEATSSIIEGRKVEALNNEENIEAIYLKKNLNFQTLPNGTCSLPINQKCPHPNACLTCKSFITSVDYIYSFKEQLKRTEKMIEFAKEKGFSQQVKTNEEIKKQLEFFIEELENGKENVKPQI